MRFPSGQRLLAIYAGVLTLVFAGTVLFGATSGSRRASFDQITVHRINVVEPDGSLRMVVANAAQAPGMFFRGIEYPRPDRRLAGILFLNDEGTENGGLIWDGGKSADGKASSHGHLSFDNFEQDQVMRIEANQDATGRKSSFIDIWDRPEWSLQPLAGLVSDGRLSTTQRQAAVEAFLRDKPRPQPRLFFGRRDDGSAGVVLHDAAGRARIVLRVDADGAPVLKFLDAEGKVLQQLPGPTAR